MTNRDKLAEVLSCEEGVLDPADADNLAEVIVREFPDFPWDATWGD